MRDARRLRVRARPGVVRYSGDDYLELNANAIENFFWN